MNKKEFTRKLLDLLTKFDAASEAQRKKLGKEIAAFFKKNYRFTDGSDAFTDPDFKEITFVLELNDYNKTYFPEENFLIGKRKLELLLKK